MSNTKQGHDETQHQSEPHVKLPPGSMVGSAESYKRILENAGYTVLSDGETQDLLGVMVCAVMQLRVMEMQLHVIKSSYDYSDSDPDAVTNLGDWAKRIAPKVEQEDP